MTREKEVTIAVAKLIQEPRRDGGYHQLVEFAAFIVDRIADKVIADGVVIPIDRAEYLAKLIGFEIATGLLRLVRENN